jgi:acetyl esterase/lipase
MNDASSIIWGGMNRAQLDAAYDNTAAVADAATRRDGWIARSAEMRKNKPELLDLAYGPRERNRIDVFRCGKANAPLFVFIHGGYWQRNSKDMFACMMAGPLAKGCDAAMIGYTLCPDVTLTELVAETHAAIRYLRKEGPRRGFGGGKLVVSGWSAGGHLAAMAMQLPAVNAGLAISGLYDLEPIRHCYVNDKLRLDALEAQRNSPISLPAYSEPVTIAYGANELPALCRQSEAYARKVGHAKLLRLPGHDHFTILEELASPKGALTREVRTLVESL